MSSRIKLYLDEDVEVLLADLVRSKGFDAITTRDAGRHNRSEPDAEQLAFAASQDRAIVTHNRDDFSRLHREYLDLQRPHSGIFIAIRRPTIYHVARRLLAFLHNRTNEEMRSHIQFV